jgi:hypothetical protein
MSLFIKGAHAEEAPHSCIFSGRRNVAGAQSRPAKKRLFVKGFSAENLSPSPFMGRGDREAAGGAYVGGMAPSVICFANATFPINGAGERHETFRRVA